MQTAVTNRNQEVIVAEAADIMRRFHEPGMKHQPKDPTVVAKLIALREESGLPVSTFCYKVRCSEGVFYMWSGGCNSSGKPWPKLAEALALRKGTALAAAMTAELGQGKPTPPVQASASEELQAAGASLLAELGGKPTGNTTGLIVERYTRPGESLEQAVERSTVVLSDLSQKHKAPDQARAVEAVRAVVEGTAPAKRKPGRPPGSKSKKASVDTRAVGDIRIVSIEDSGVIIRERVEVVREEIAPGTPEHTAILRDLYKRTHN